MKSIFLFSFNPDLFWHGNGVGKECFSKEDGLPGIFGGGAGIVCATVSDKAQFISPIKYCTGQYVVFPEFFNFFGKPAVKLRRNMLDGAFNGFSGHDYSRFKHLNIFMFLRFDGVHLKHGLFDILRQVARRCLDFRFGLKIDQTQWHKAIHSHIKHAGVIHGRMSVSASERDDGAPVAAAASRLAFEDIFIFCLRGRVLKGMNYSENNIVMPAVRAKMRDGCCHD